MQQLLTSLEHYKALYEQEIRAVTEQIATERQQAKAVERELESLKALRSAGSRRSRVSSPPSVRSRRFPARYRVAGDDLARPQNIGQTEQRRIEAINARSLRVNGELQTARAEQKEAAQRVRASRALLYEAQVTAPDALATEKLEVASLHIQDPPRHRERAAGADRRTDDTRPARRCDDGRARPAGHS